MARGALALSQLQREQVQEAETALSVLDDPVTEESIHRSFLLDVRAQLRLAQRRPREALGDATRAGHQLESQYSVTNPGVVAWRSTAALALVAGGDRKRAIEVAAEELEQARQVGVTRVIKRDMRVLGLATGGKEGIELLREAVGTGEDCGTRLEHIHALIDLGAALRRANQRAAAREPLSRALELSTRLGAIALERRAESELTTAGAPRTGETVTGLESLTPSERRVADLAADGLSTREIAEALFVTPKTIEYHLRNTYKKLHINSRAKLARVVAKDQLES
jgi:DNA-binding NarL/FixJ family response regulator